MKKLTYGERLKAARKQKGWSQDILAKRSGVGQASISKIERGDQDASIYDIELAYALDVQPIWLKHGEAIHAPEWLLNPGAATTTDNKPRTRIELILDAAEDAMYDSGLQFSDKEKLEYYIEAIEFAGSKQFSPKLITNYLLETIRAGLKKIT